MNIQLPNKTLTIPENKKYYFPSDLTAKSYEGFLLLISPSNGNWIVLENKLQVDITKMLYNGFSVQQVSSNLSKSEIIDFNKVIIQLECKHFCEKIISDDSQFLLRLYLTNKCNLRCKHCFMYAADALENELETDEIIELIEKCSKHGCNKIILTGGEVTLHPDFVTILEYAKKNHLYTQVMTNGTLWTESTFLRAHPFIDEIQISIDGFNEKTNSQIRGANTFAKALSTLDKFYNYTKSFINLVITPTYELAEYHKSDYINFSKALITKYGYERFLIIFGNEILNGRDIKADKSKNLQFAQTIDDIYESLYPNSKITTFVVNHHNNRIYKNCGYGGLTVNSNGDYYFCGRINEVKCYGNIRQKDIVNILTERKTIRSLSYVDNLVPCKNCDLKYICGGECRVKNFPQVTTLDPNSLNITYSRHCPDSLKNSIYHLMIESNDYLLGL